MRVDKLQRSRAFGISWYRHITSQSIGKGVVAKFQSATRA